MGSLHTLDSGVPDESSTNPKIDRLLKAYKALQVEVAITGYNDVKDSENVADINTAKEKLAVINDELVRIIAPTNQLLAGFIEEIGELGRTTKRTRKALTLSKHINSLKKLKEVCEDQYFVIMEILGGVPVMPEVSNFNRRDSLLRNIDESLRQYERAIEIEDKEKFLGQLFFAADYWLKVAANPSEYELFIDTRKTDEITRLYSKTVKALLLITDAPSANKLPEYLESHFGKGMAEHGVKLDFEDEMANYMEDGDRDKFRTYVKGGKLFQRKWWVGSNKLVLADSSKTIPEGKDMGGRSGYIISMSGDIYLARHKTPEETEKGMGIYHSSYMKGMPVLCAGEILITKGVISVMNTYSGHYRPTDRNMVQTLKVLKMIGINISTIDVFTLNIPDPMKGDAFIEHVENSNDGSAELAEYLQNDHEQIVYRQQIFKDKLLEEQKSKVAAFQDAMEKSFERGNYKDYPNQKYPQAREIIEYIKEKIRQEGDFTKDERMQGIRECKAIALHHTIVTIERAPLGLLTKDSKERKLRASFETKMHTVPIDELDAKYDLDTNNLSSLMKTAFAELDGSKTYIRYADTDFEDAGPEDAGVDDVVVEDAGNTENVDNLDDVIQTEP